MTGRFVKVVPDMTIEELRRWSAEKLCGWKKEYVFGLPGEKWYIAYSGPCANFIVKVKDWAPNSDQSPAWQILKVESRMKELGWYLSLYAWPDGTFHADFSKVHGKHPVGVEFNSIGKDMLTTILHAAHAAWEGR